MEKCVFYSVLLVPVPEKAQGARCYWAASLSSLVEKANVIAFNTENKEDIKSLLKADLEELRAKENPTDNDLVNMRFKEQVLGMIGVTGYDHVVPKTLLATLNEYWGVRLQAKDVIYLSWVVGKN